MLCISPGVGKFDALEHTRKKTLNKYQTIQNICAKIVLNKPKYSSYNEALKTLHWLPIWQWIQYKILTLMFKCMHNMAPGYLQEFITIKQNARENMRSNNKGTILKIPKVKRETFAAKVFSHSAPIMWNRLPKHIRDLTLLDQFKSKLKTHLYTMAFLTEFKLSVSNEPTVIVKHMKKNNTSSTVHHSTI